MKADQEFIDQLRAANFVNIAKKVKSGKTLTQAEQKTIDEHLAKTKAAERAKPVAAKKAGKPAAKFGAAANLKAAASRMDVPVEMLKDAKNAGCDAFSLRGSVDCDRVAEWIANNPEFAAKWEGEGAVPAKAVSDAWSAHWVAKERERRYKERIEKLVARAQYGQDLRTLAGRQKAILENNEGKTLTPIVIAQICQLMQEAVSGLFKQIEP